eukprot:9713761-Alexandrium_andersonii.AAC.2
MRPAPQLPARGECPAVPSTLPTVATTLTQGVPPPRRLPLSRGAAGVPCRAPEGRRPRARRPPSCPPLAARAREGVGEEFSRVP